MDQSTAVPAAKRSLDKETGFVRELGLFDSVMIVIGVMIGSGIFIVPADMARNIGSSGWLLVAWLFAGVLTVFAAVSYGELAAMLPSVGGVYVYLREAFSPSLGSCMAGLCSRLFKPAPSLLLLLRLRAFSASWFRPFPNRITLFLPSTSPAVTPFRCRLLSWWPSSSSRF